ncbi:hypothetical protein TNCV_357181 [Trichonephila clavipes]|nr:hypothetical protein TNCV_357181 [Trichonephila clavipes]
MEWEHGCRPESRGVQIQGLDLLSLSLSMSVSESLSPNRGASSFCSMPFHNNILERTICLVHLIASNWSRTSAELPHKVQCHLEERETPMTHLRYL